MGHPDPAHLDAQERHTEAAPSAPRERPILFSAPMVRALLDGRKSQTRRIVKPQPHHGPIGQMVNLGDPDWAMDDGDLSGLWRCPYGAPGDRLWAREGCWIFGQWHEDGLTARGRKRWRFKAVGQRVLYENPGREKIAHLGGVPGWSRRNSIHMPRWASRITLRITDVRVERLNDISEADALAEGIERIRFPEVGEWGWPQRMYRDLWNQINGPGSWDANPWVWAVSFELITPSPASPGIKPLDRKVG
jgi:hypothetical protein